MITNVTDTAAGAGVAIEKEEAIIMIRLTMISVIHNDVNKENEVLPQVLVEELGDQDDDIMQFSVEICWWV